MNKVLLSIRDLQVRYGDRVALEVSALDLYEGEILAIIGPNGAGKTTLLYAVAGLVPLARGKILLRGQTVNPHQVSYRRRLALVLQEPVLLDLSVLANVLLGLRIRRLPRQEAETRALEALERLGVAHLAHRSARTLSGGEAQRVCLARALALRPEVLLLDEPFSSLDAPTRAALLADLRDLLRQSRTTTLFVTHNQDEALQLGDRIAVLLQGRVRQVGPPEQVFGAPADEEVAAFVGVENRVSGQVVAWSDGGVIVEVGSQRLEVAEEAPVGQAVWVCLRPEDVTLFPADQPLTATSARNRFYGRVVRVEPRGRLYHVTVDCGFHLVATVTPRSLQELGLTSGQEVVVAFKATAAHLLLRGQPAGWGA
ncbi:MAG TPA: ABC transporter ATP-binding protein [Thermoflexus sp.]|nr:ABC transporter ATP-binding protein [Thermoflexus sp.]